MTLLQPICTRTDTLFPYAALFRSYRLYGGRDSGAIDEEARDPIGRPCGIEPGGNTLLIGDIDPREQPADHRGMRLTDFLVEIEDRHLGAEPGEHRGGRAAETRGTASDNCG